MFYNQSPEEVLKVVSSNEKWLTHQEANKRLEKYGYNEINQEKKFSMFKIFFSQFTDPIVIVLIFATAISFILGENIDSIVIAAILVVNAILGFIQEYKAEKAIELLSKLSSPTSVVIRDNKRQIISSRELVPGDIVLLEIWDKISADIRLLETMMFTIDESSLTGESIPVNKDIEAIDGVVAIADQKNMVFSWTVVVSWRAMGVVVETGMNTQIGKIANVVQQTEETKTPLQHNLKKLGITLGSIVLIVVALVFMIGWIQGLNLFEIFFTSVSLAVGAIPEWLPAVVTIVLALGVQKMYKKNVLVRKLKSIETLWSVTVICSDKTWTITQNKMTVTDIYIDNKDIQVQEEFYYAGKKISSQSLSQLFQIASNCNNAVLPNIGDPTEIALLEVSKKGNIIADKKRIGEVPFDSEKKYMITHHEDVKYLKWSPEAVLELCKRYYLGGEVILLDNKKKQEILNKNSHMASQALRVLGFAYQDTEHDAFIFTGLMGMIDPPRPEVKNALALCQKAGIRVVMITWDHKETAVAIAKQIGIQGEVMEGKELDTLEDLQYTIDKVSIFARVNPEHKVRILEAFQKKGDIVAMTGDGINDAPALKKADVGVAMSLKGTDVAREASDIILVDDNFASIVNAIEYGRIMYDNIRKFVKLLLSANIPEVMIIFITIVLWAPLPMLPVQILRINLMTDSFPAIALGMDPGEKNIMTRKPRQKNEHILSHMWRFISIASVIVTVVALILYINANNVVGIAKARTLVITMIIIFELFLVFAVRSDKYNIWELKNNMSIWRSILIVLWLHILAIYYTPLAHAFKFVALGRWDRLVIVGLGSLGFVFFEIMKMLKKRW